jgi:hypothetical protein
MHEDETEWTGRGAGGGEEEGQMGENGAFCGQLHY